MPTPTFEPISSVVMTGTTSNHSFTSIPNTYKHLQIVFCGKMVGGPGYLYGRFNSDTGANYVQTTLYPSGGSWSSSGNPSSSVAYYGQNSMFNSSSIGMQVIDIIDYTNTNIYKNWTGYGGTQANEPELVHGVWRITNAINDIYLQFNTGSFAAGTTITLYGLAG